MARVRSSDRSTRNVHRHPTEVDCEYALIDDGEGRLLHLSTFGSDGRKSKPKSSQGIQLDATGARELIRIINEAFPGL